MCEREQSCLGSSGFCTVCDCTAGILLNSTHINVICLHHFTMLMPSIWLKRFINMLEDCWDNFRCVVFELVFSACFMSVALLCSVYKLENELPISEIH